MLDQKSNQVTWMGTTYRTPLTTADTDGRISITDSVTPAYQGPPRHIHHAEDEAFVVLSGDIEFWMDGETYHRGPGEAIFVPRGIEHTFRVSSDVPSRHLVILTPGGFEKFFYEMAEASARIPEDMEIVNESASRHNLSFVGPPLD